MCQIPAKFENKGTPPSMKIKDLRSTVRELVLGVKGTKKDDVIQVPGSSFLEACRCLSHLRNGQRLREKSINISLRRFASLIPSFDNEFRRYVLNLGIWNFNTFTLMFSINASLAFEPIFKRDKLANTT